MSYAKRRAGGLPLGIRYIPTPKAEEQAPSGSTYRISIRLDHVESTLSELGGIPREDIKIISSYRQSWENFGRFSQAEKAHITLHRLLRELHGEAMR